MNKFRFYAGVVISAIIGTGIGLGLATCDEVLTVLASDNTSTSVETGIPPVPETTVPETTVPETKTTVPETTVPETTVPETTVPETDINYHPPGWIDPSPRRRNPIPQPAPPVMEQVVPPQAIASTIPIALAQSWPTMPPTGLLPETGTGEVIGWGIAAGIVLGLGIALLIARRRI